MKYKSLSILLVVIMLVISSGSALAQGTTPPAGSDDPDVLLKSEFLAQGTGSTSRDAVPSARDGAPSAATLVNGNFEQGAFVGWDEYSNHGWPVVLAPGASLPITPHSGSWLVWLGGAYDEIAHIAQTLTVPNASSLRLYYWIASANPCGLSDVARVTITDLATSLSSHVHTWDLCASNETGDWQALDLDLSAYGGKSIRLMIQISTNGTGNSNFFIDDVSLYGTFVDVSYDHWAADYIQRLSNAGITGGCGTKLYCPETSVTRDQMAVFLLRGIHGSAYAPPAIGASTGFADVPTDYWSGAWIKQLAAEGITGGCGSGIYCPAAPVTRAQMAIFLLRSKYGASYTPPAVGSSTGFNDVPTTYWAGAWIKQLVTEGITAGCGAGTYCPEAPVTRAQMAVFLVRTFNLP